MVSSSGGLSWLLITGQYDLLSNIFRLAWDTGTDSYVSSVSSSLSVSYWDTTTTVCMFGQPKYSRVGSSQAGPHQHHDQARIRFRFRNDRWMFGQPGTGETGELHWCVLTNLVTQLTSKPDTGGWGATDWSTPSFTSFPHYTKYITGGQALCLLDHRNFQCAGI